MLENKRLNSPAAGLFLFILCCFLLSGVCGLIYEILWMRLIIEVIGAAPFSVSIILTVFMGGLGLGSYLASRIVDRIDSALKLMRIYGMLELVIGASALLIPALITAFQPLQTVLYNKLYNHFIIYNLFTFLICAVILCVPAICMGATLPLLCRFYIARLDHLGTNAGRLYGLNTIGAATGAMICGFWLINLWGVSGTLAFAVAINTMIGLSCLMVSYKAEARHTAVAPSNSDTKNFTSKTVLKAEPSFSHAERNAVLVIFFVSGFCAMAAEVIWTRLLGLIVGPTTYSFTIVLVVFISGLALGSMIFGYLADRVKDCLKLLLFTQIAAALFVLVVSEILGNSQMLFAKLIFTFKDNFGLLSIIKAVVLFLFMILPTLFFGATFPLVGKIYTRSVAKVGESIGFSYMINTIGSLCGPFVAGFLMIPFIGKESALKLLVSFQLLTALLIIAVVIRRPDRIVRQFGWMAVPAILGLVLCFYYPAWSHRLLATGKYQDFENIRRDLAATGWIASLLNGSKILERAEKGELLFYGEGAGGFTTVVKLTDALGNINFAMANSGKTDASSRRDMETQTLLAHLPMLSHKNPQKVMVIGLASGITAGEVLCYPVKRLDILEINEQVVEASNYFIPWNNKVLSDPRARLIIQDARAHLQHTDQIYDVIISEPSNPWMAGLAALFTEEFFSLAKRCLSADGIFAQWIHAYQMDWDTFALVGRTFAKVFPNSRLVNMTPHKRDGDYLIIGYNGGEKTDFEDVEQKQSDIRRSKNIVLKDPRLLYQLMVSDNLLELFGPGGINTDGRPRLEFAAPKLMYHSKGSIHENIQAKRLQTLSAHTTRMIRQNDASVDAQIDFAAYALSVYSPFSGMVDLSRATASQKERFFELIDNYCSENELDYSIFKENELRQRCVSIQLKVLEDKMDRVPDRLASLSYLGNLYALQGNLSEAIASYEEALRLDPRFTMLHTNLGIAFTRKGNFDEAIRHFTRAVQLEPQDPQVHYNLAMVLMKTGRLDEAIRHFLRTLQIEPDHAEAHYEIGLARANQGALTDAIEHFTEAVRIKPEFMRAHNDLGVALARQGQMDDAIREFTRALQIAPEDAEVHNNLGLALAQKGRIEDAVYHFNAALRIKPDFTAALDNLKWARGLEDN